MSNNKFHKILSDTITLPLLPADKFNETNTGYYAVLEKNYIPITSDIECIYKPDWITGYKFIKEGENGNETNGNLKYYNKLIITSISDNTTEKLRKDVMEFAVRNNVQSLTPINHIYAKVSQIPKENIEVHLEFIPTDAQNGHLNKDGGVISGDEQEIHIKYWAVLNKRNQSNVTLNLNGNLLDKDKIKSLKINSSDNTVELVYLIDENIGSQKALEFEAIFKTQYNEVNQQKTIIQNVNTYTITLEIDKPNPVVFNGDNRILTYKCTYTDGINTTSKEVKDNLQLEFSYDNTQNQINYSVIKTIYVDGAFKTTINVDENYTSEQRYLKVNVVYDNGSNKLKSAVKQIIQDKADIKLQYYVEYLDRDKNKIEVPSTNGTYNVSAFGETIRLHYYGIIKIVGKNSVKITSVTNTKNDISTTYTINALIDGVQYNNVTLNGDEYILDINFDRNESADITKTIKFNMNDISSASCKLTQGVLSIDLTIKQDECTEKIGGIPEYNNIILVFRAYDKEKGITIEDVNLYTITCDNDDVNLLDIQYEIITYNNKNYIVASNIRCKNIYDKNVDRLLTFSVKYNTKTVSHVVTQKSVIYACEIRPSSNYVSALGEDKFEVISVGIIKDGYLVDKHLETSVDNVQFTNTTDDNTPGYIHVIQGNRKLVNKSQSIIKVDPQSMGGEPITTKKDITFRIKVKYHDSTNYYDIKQLYLQIYVELYKESSYSTLLDYTSLRLNISPFINNILYYKCYVCEINETDGSPKKVDISKFQGNGFSISAANWVDVQAYVDENPTYNKEDYTYRGKITIPRYICTVGVTYKFMYMQYYSNDLGKSLYIFKSLNIYKPEIRTSTVDDLNPVTGTYIQYRSDKDSSYNDNKSILKIGTDDKGISSKGYQVTLYYRTVFTIILGKTDNYIYGNSYKTYIDLDKKHFQSFVNTKDITIDNNEFSNAEEVKYNDSSYLKITFKVNKNDGLKKRSIYKSIKYQFKDDTINGTDYYYTWNVFTNYNDNVNNRIEIYQDGASLDLSAFFDDNNAGVLSDSSRTITYNAKPQLKQNLHVRVLLNDELQPTQSEYFKFIANSSTFQIDNGILDSTLNTYKSEYNLTDLYIEPENRTYKFNYYYNENNKTKDLTVIRTSFGKDDKCELNAEIDYSEIGNEGKTVKITFWLTYTNNEIIDLGEDAIGKFIYKFGKNDEKPVAIKPSSNTFTVVYNQKTKKYSFDSTINANLTINPITYKFIIQFGDDDDKHKKTLTCTQGSSSYELKATIEQPTLLPLSPLSPSNIIIKCNVEKDNKDEIYPDVYERNFSIIQTNETKDENGNNRLTELSSGLQLGEYRKEYKVADNKTANSITYEFKCSYTLNGKPYEKSLSITQSGAKFGVSIYDGETDQSKQNIVNPVGEIKTINYFGILNDEHILNQDEVKFSYKQEGGGVTLIKEVGDVIPDTENNVLSRKYKFELNATANTITYTFTVTYQNISKSISFTQKPGDIKLILKNEPDPIPKSGGQCKIIYYGYVGADPNIKENHITTDFLEPKYTEVEGFMSYTPTKVSGPTVTDYQIEYVFSVPTRVEDINIDKLFKLNWSVTYKNGDIQKSIDKDIVQNGDSEFFPAFDIFGLVYEWSNGGCDLDTATLLTRSDDGQLIINDTDVDICKNSFGFSQSNNNKSNKVYNYIAFSSDNQHGCGYESIAINFKKLLNDFKLSKLNITLNFDIWMTWYAGKWNGDVNIKFVRYTDISFKTNESGNILFQSGNFNPKKSYLYLLNNNIDQLDTTNSSIKITEKSSNVDSKGESGNYKTGYAKVGRLQYNTKLKTAILSINQIANSSKRAVIRKQKIELNINNLYTDVHYPEYKGYTYTLDGLFSNDNNIQKGITVKMKMLYRDSSVSSPTQRNLSYVNSSITNIQLYNSSISNTYTTLPTTHNYYNDILPKNKYAPKSNNINICEFPDIDINSITSPPTSVDNKTYYGLYSFYIKYAYKYTIPSDSCILTFSRYVYVAKKL